MLEDKELDLVSVLIPYYNDERYLKESIESVLSQTYTNFELILINHASTDSSFKIAHEFKDKRIIHLDIVKNQGAGGGDIMDLFRKTLSGKYVKLFCADDVMKSDCLETFINYINECGNTLPEKFLIFGDVEYIDSNSNSLTETFFSSRCGGFNRLPSSEEEALDLIVNKRISVFPYIGSFFPSMLLSDLTFDHSLIMMFDLSLWIEMLLLGAKLKFISKVISYYRVHSNQMSALNNNNKFWSNVVCGYEYAYLCHKPLINTENLTLVKKLFSESEYVSLINDPRDIPFFVNQALFKRKRDLVSYYKLHEMLEDTETRKRLVQVFNYDVREFRNDIGSKEDMYKKNWREKMYKKHPGELNILNLIYLCVRRIKVVFISIFKSKKNYSL